MSARSYTSGLTRRQLQVLRCIVESVEQHGVPPTVQELCRALGCRSTNAVHQLLLALERKGYIRRRGRGQARNIQLTEKALGGGTKLYVPQGRSIPVLRAGIVVEPQQVFRLPQGYLFADPALFPEEELFAVIVSDEGLSGVGILAGDIVVAWRSDVLAAGKLVVAWVNGAIVVRTLSQGAGAWELRTTTQRGAPIRFHPPDPEVSVLGHVVGVIRRIAPPQT